MIETNKIYQGHVSDILRTFPDESVNCVITSPPYWGLRDYGLDPIIWDADIILHCTACNGIIKLDRELFTIKEVFGENNNQRKKQSDYRILRYLQKSSNEILSEQPLSSKNWEGVLQESQCKNSLHGGTDKTTQSKIQHGGEQHELEGWEKDNNGRLYLSFSSCESSNKREKKRQEKIYSRTSTCNGKEIGALSGGLGESSSQKRNQKRQQNKKFGISEYESSSGKNNLSALSQDFLDKIDCPICSSKGLNLSDCEHEWGDEIIKQQRGIAGTGNTGNHSKIIPGQDTHQVQGQFCLKCSAWRGSLGLDPTPELYLKHLLEIFDEVKRVLRKDGTCWVNIGDSYSGTHVGYTENHLRWQHGETKKKEMGNYAKNIPSKSLCLIPYRFATGMVERGWILRNIINWHKPNCMPSSAKDRFTVDFEPVFFFVKSQKYWFEQQFEEHSESTLRMSKYPDTWRKENKRKDESYSNFLSKAISNPQGRNRRCVWTIPTQPYKEAHFATFSEALVEPMIRAGSPKHVCPKCKKGF